MKYPFTPKELKSAIKELGVKSGDLVFCHSNIGLFGRIDKSVSRSDYFDMIVNQILEIIGSKGTLVLPAFTYSAPNNKLFNPKEANTSMGLLVNYLIKKGTFMRSLDPNVSVIAYGRLANKICSLGKMPPYSRDGLFHYLSKNETKILNMNLDAGSTFIHFFEKEYKVKYRYIKKFKSSILLNCETETFESQLYVNNRDMSGTEANFSQFARYAVLKNVYLTKNLGRGFLGLISVENTKKIVFSLLEKDENSLINLGVDSDL